MSDNREHRPLSVPLPPGSQKAVATSDRGLESGKSRSSVAGTGTKLKIKIKLPERSCESDSMRDDKEVEEEHVCTLCRKGFRSGKALGGHMRVHAQRDRSDQLKTSTVFDRAAADDSCDMDVDEEGDDDELQMKDSGKPICPICRRDFPSNKALFGHMRCHPERKWRGIQPPVYSSSSTVSDVQARSSSSSSSDKSDHNDGDPFKSGVTDLEKDLLNFGWGTKDRRGREGTVKSIAPEQAAGVQNLILLSRGGVDLKSGKSEVGPEIKSKPLPAGPGIRDSTNFTRKLKLCGAEVESRGRVDHDSQWRRRKKRKTSQVLTTEEVSGLTNSAKKSKFAHEEVEGSHDDDGTQDLMIVESNPLHQLTGRRPPMISATDADADVMSLEKVDASPHGYDAAELMQADLTETKKTHKVRKYLMISDLKPMSANLPAHSSPVNPPALHQDINTEVPDNERYKCTTCNKTFSSHQALGGHKSSHNKLRNPQGFRNDHPHPDSVTTQGGEGSIVDTGARHISGLIMAAAAAAAAATPVHSMHQCNVCFKIYPTGQALGGHKRLHCSLITSKALPLPPPSMVIQEPEAAPLPPPPSMIISEPEAASFHPHAPPLAQAFDNDHGVVGRFDLNELPAVEDEDDQHAVIQPVDNIAAQPQEAAGDDKDAHEPGDSPAALDY